MSDTTPTPVISNEEREATLAREERRTGALLFVQMSVVGSILAALIGLALPFVFAAIAGVALALGGARAALDPVLGRHPETVGKAWSFVVNAVALVAAAWWARAHGYAGGVPVSTEFGWLVHSPDAVIGWLQSH